MKGVISMKKNLITLALLSFFSLSSCRNSSATGSSKPSAGSGSSTTNSVSPKPEPPTLGEDEFSYLIGNYYTLGGGLSVSSSKVKVIDGEKTYSLVPSAVVQANYPYSDESKGEYESLTIEFSKLFNEGVEYQAYVNFEDGLLHLEDISDVEAPKTLGVYMPDLSSLAGTYSAYGDGDEYNMYFNFDGHFDSNRGVFPSSMKGYASFSDEQIWYLKSSFVKLNDRVYTAYERFDGDDYGYGKEVFVKEESKISSYQVLKDGSLSSYADYVSDAGGYNRLKLYDGTAGFTTSMDPVNHTIVFLGEKVTYSTLIDDTGFHLVFNLQGKHYVLSIGEYHVDAMVDGVLKSFAVDDVSALYGSFVNGDESFEIRESEEEGGMPSVLVNGTKVEGVSYTLFRKRKTLKFTKDGSEYVIAPDRKGVSILLSKGGNLFYPFDKSLFVPYFTGFFVYQNYQDTFTLSIGSDLSYSLLGKKGKADLSFFHGDKYPKLSFEVEGKKSTLSLVQKEIGYYLLKDETGSKVLYSSSVLDSLYGTYSTDGVDAFVFSPSGISFEGKQHSYAFSPYLEPALGTYTFGVKTDDGTYYRSNLKGTFYSDTSSMIDKSLFASLYGTFSGYGKLGIENIRFTEDGKLYLDSLNEDKSELVRDVEYSYNIMTDTLGQVLLHFQYNENTRIFIYFRDGYVEIASLKYYNRSLLDYWGTYVLDDTVVFFQNDTVYVNGISEMILEKRFEEGKTILVSANHTFTFYDGNVTMDSKDACMKLQRKFSYSDYKKFFGTYSLSGSSIVFEEGDFGYSLKLDSRPVSSFYIIKKDGKMTLTFDGIGTKYYLSLDEQTGEVTASFESSLPPLPPPPPLP